MSRPIVLPSVPLPPRAIAGLALWLALALALALSEALTLERRFAVPILLFSLVAAQIALYVRGGAFRTFADAVDTRTLLLFQAVRAPIGAAFLVLMSYGLDETFARVAGIGDVIAGSLALVLALTAPRSRPLLLAWNVLGFVDMIAVIVTVQRVLLLSDHPQTLSMLVHFPGLLLPSFLVPLIVAVHLLVFARIRRQ